MYVEHNKFIVIKIKYKTWIAKQFIATYVRNLNYTRWFIYDRDW